MIRKLWGWLWQPEPEDILPLPEDGADPRVWVKDVSRRVRNIERAQSMNTLILIVLTIAFLAAMWNGSVHLTIGQQAQAPAHGGQTSTR